MQLTPDMKTAIAEEMTEPGNSNKVAALVYVDEFSDRGWSFKLLRNMASAYEKREEMWESGTKIDDTLVVDIWEM